MVADGGRYQGLKRALDNQYLMEGDAYPTTMPQALKLLETFKPESTADVSPNETGGGAGVAFTRQVSVLSPAITVVRRVIM